MNSWDDAVSTLREIADVIERQVPPAFEVIEAARDALAALEALQDRGDGSLVSPARQRLTGALKALEATA
jgi:hypothetical protein